MKTIKTMAILLVSSAIIFSCKKKKDEAPAPEEPTSTGGATVTVSDWTIKSANTTKNLKKIKFFGASVGFILGDSNAVLKTKDGGASWIALVVPTFNEQYSGVHYFDSLNIVLCNSGSVLTTTNGGTSWITASTFTLGMSFFSDMAFLNSTTGYITGSQGLIKTVDAGVTWSVVNGITGSMRGIKFIDALTGWAYSYDKVYRTTDGGQTWVDCNAGLTSMTSASFVDNSIAYISSSLSSHTIKKTTDGGQTWANVFSDNTLSDSQSAMWFTDANSAFEGRLLYRIRKSTDGGVTWAVVSSPLANQAINGFYFFNANSGWAVGSKGIVLKYK